MRRLKILLLSAAAVIGCGLLQIACAADEPWPVDGKLLGKKDKKSKDVSGIACANEGLPRKCLVIDDEVQFVQVVIVKEGELVAGDTLALVDPDDTPWNIDREAVAFSAAGAGRPDAFYVVGSHGHPRDRQKKLDALADAGQIKARFDASSVLVRVPLGASGIDDDGKLARKPKAITLVDLRPMIYLEPAFAPVRPFLGKRLEEDRRGLTIEGLAAVEGRLYVGLRAPTLGAAEDRAAILSFDQDAPFDGKPLNAKLDLLAVGEKRGIRDLAAHGTGLLVLTGPAYEPNMTRTAGKTGEYSIYAWDRRDGLRLMLDLPPFAEGGEPVKPEALLPLRTHADGSADVLILSDGATEGGPRLVRIPK